VRAGFENAGSLWRGEGASGFRFGASGIAAYLAPILDIATRRDVLSDKGRRGYRFDEDKFGRLADIDQSDNALPTPHNRDNWFGRAVWAKRDANAAERAAIEAQFDEKGYGPPGVPGRGMPASSFNVQDISRVMGFGAEPVKAVVEGNATLNTTVTVNAGEGFWAKVDQKIENAINAFRSTSAPARGTAGSTGGSSPDAAPAH
jgi:hypothetical protein